MKKSIKQNEGKLPSDNSSKSTVSYSFLIKPIILCLCLLLQQFISAQNQNILSGQNIVLTNQNLTRSNITINNGGELKLTNCNLTMDIGGRITVNPGGRLFLNGTTIKSASSSGYWEGILVEGNPNLPQNPTSNQGFVNITQSKINSARIALATKSLDANGNIFWSKTGGGIIIVSNTTIKDCKEKHVEFMSYKNRLNGKEINNISRFTNCDFFQFNIKHPQVQVNPSSNPLVLSNYSTPFIATLWDVKGVTFNGCHFSGYYPMNFNDPYDIQKAYHSPSGIFTYDASVIIQDNKTATSTSPLRRSYFSGLNVGIANYFAAINDDLSNINNCDFGATDISICQNGGTGSLFYRNNFFLNYCLSQVPYGSALISFPGKKIKTDNSIGMLIEENSFFHKIMGSYQPDALFSTHWSTIVTNADRGMTGQGIPLSKFTRNNHSHALNALQTQQNNTQLKITCNSFNAGGVFLGLQQDGQINLNPVSLTGQTPFFGNCNGTSTKMDYNNIFGNAQTNQKDIFNYTSTNPNLPYVIKSTLPYRPAQPKSYQINITDCGTPITINPEICVSNLPIEPGWNIGLPSKYNPPIYGIKKGQTTTFKNIIENPNSSPQQKDEAQIQLSYLLTEIGEMRAEKLGYHQYMQLFDDEAEDHLAELITFLENDNDLFSQKMLLGIYINHQQFELAQAILANITTTTPNDLAYKNLCSLLVTLGIENRNVFMLTQAEETLVRDIAYGETTSAVDAQGILALVFNEVLAKNTEKYPGTEVIEAQLYRTVSAQNSKLIIFPNPSYNQDVVARFETQSISNQMEIKVYNYLGDFITEHAIEPGNQTGDVTFEANLFETGFYVIQFIIDGHVVDYKTLSFVR